MASRPLAQCKMSSPCDGGTSWLVAFIPEERARVGLTARMWDRTWTITEAYTNLICDSEYIAWYPNFN